VKKEISVPKVSIKEKYGKLIDKGYKSKYDLPYHYRELLEIFEYLDHFLFLYIHKQKSTFLTPIFNSLKRVIHKKITEREIG